MASESNKSIFLIMYKILFLIIYYTIISVVLLMSLIGAMLVKLYEKVM